MEEHKAYDLQNPKSAVFFINKAREEGFGINYTLGMAQILMNSRAVLCPGTIYGERILVLCNKDGPNEFDKSISKFDKSVSKLQKLAEEFKA